METNEKIDTPKQPPPKRTLNPKLTARRPYPAEPPPLDIDPVMARKKFLQDIGVIAQDSDRSDHNEEENPRADLLHNGEWVPKQYSNGRPIKFTGIWSCCGNPDKMSIYCESIESREILLQSREMEKMMQMNEDSYRKDNKKDVSNAPPKYELRLGSELSPEDMAMKEISTKGSSYNAPMLMSWLTKYINVEHTVQSGIQLLLEHVKTGEGCILMQNHGAFGCICRIIDIYKHKETIVLHAIMSLRKLLDCNYTRDGIIMRSVDALRTAFYVFHRYMQSLEHVEHAVQCIMQCVRSELCRVDFLERQLQIYLTIACKRYSRKAVILRPILKIFNWVTTNVTRMAILYDHKAVVTTLKCMQRHIANGEVLAPGMLFLTRAAAMHPDALRKLLELRAVPVIIGALRALFNNEVLQLEGLKLIQQLSQTSEGWKQIQETRGGWQSICQGTTLGNALIHDLPGYFHNPGWSIGDTPNMSILDRSMLEAQKALELRSKTHEASSFWNPHTLREFMGISHGKHMTLAINTEYHATYFQLLQTLDLLPTAEETKEDWFQRINKYEKENEIRVEDMVLTMLSLKSKELERQKEEGKKKKLAAMGMGGTNEDEYVKPVYVMGEQVTTASLEKKDIAIAEQLEGVL